MYVPLPDFQWLYVALTTAGVGFVCGCVGLAIALYCRSAARVRFGGRLGVVATAAGLVAPALSVLLYWGTLGWQGHVYVAAPLIPGVLAAACARRRLRPRGFPVS